MAHRHVLDPGNDPSTAGRDGGPLARALRERTTVDGDLVRVDRFLNHVVDPTVIADVGRGLARLARRHRPDLLLTAEASGIPPTAAAAAELGLPYVYAKKYARPGARDAYVRAVTSPTKGTEYRVEVARHALPPGARVVVVDDFCSRGRTAEALGEIVLEAGASPVAFLFVVEKAYEPGRARLEARGWTVEALATVRSRPAGGDLDIVVHRRAPDDG